MSITELTTDSAWVVGLAIVALLAAGWRKPARATASLARASRAMRDREPVTVVETVTERYRRTSLWRRVWAVVASGGLAVIAGAILATLISAAVAYSVITLTDMLRR